MTTKQLVNYAALAYFLLYGVVFFVVLLSKNAIPDNYINFVLAALAVSFIAFTTAKSYLINCLAFSAIISSMLLFIASLNGAVLSGALGVVFAIYFFICWVVAIVNTFLAKVC